MVDRLECKLVGLGILFLLCWMGYCPLACRSAVVWSDDFNDGDFDGWTINENPELDQPDGSNWTATNNYLKLDQEDWGRITHPSSVAYGTWSFDFKGNASGIGGTGNILFISNNIHQLDGYENWTCYWIGFDCFPASVNLYLSLQKWNGSVATIIDSNSTPVHVADWHHIDITRNTTGWFSVYHNGSLILQGEDTEIDTSELFVFGCEYWQMIDNIVVRDDITTTTTTTTTSDGIDPLIIGVIGGIGVGVVIILILFFVRKR